ncbi:Abl interactor 2 [Blomia tropicalis]|nr:Abl interactor 2 [Blomia tropicalis]
MIKGDSKNNRKKIDTNETETIEDGDDEMGKRREERHNSTINETIQILMDHHIVENRKLLHESWINLDKIADYCEGNYLQSERKDQALDETKAYTTRALASVANQIHNFASNLSTLWDLQMNGLNELEARANGYRSQIRFHEERMARREIGRLTKPKYIPPPTLKVIKPLYPERYSAKKRRTNYYSGLIGTGSNSTDSSSGPSAITSSGSGGGSIDFTLLDDIGIANQVYERKNVKKVVKNTTQHYGTMGSSKMNQSYSNDRNGPNSSTNWSSTNVKSATLRPSKSSNLSAAALMEMGHTPAPTIRPPTPPSGSVVAARFSTLSRDHHHSKDYRSLHGLVVAPPQLPNNYQSSSMNNIVGSTMTTSTSADQTISNKNIVSSNVSANTTTSTSLPSSSSSSLSVTTTSMTTSNSTNPFVNKSAPLSPIPSSSTVVESPSWIPSTYLEKVVALYDYTADKDDELTFKENALIYVIAKNEDGWWEGVMNGITGLFPGNYVEPCF